MAITKRLFLDGHVGDVEYIVKKTIYDTHVLLELSCHDEWQINTLDHDPMKADDFPKPPHYIFAKATIEGRVNNPCVVFSMGDKFKEGIPILRSEFKTIRKFFDLIEAEMSHPDNIEYLEIE